MTERQTLSGIHRSVFRAKRNVSGVSHLPHLSLSRLSGLAATHTVRISVQRN